MRTRGFTLVEALLAFFIMALALGLAAELMQQYGRLLNYTSAREKTALAAQVALGRMATEVREATVFLSPLTGSSTVQAELRFQKPDPATPRLPVALPSPPPGSWEPYPLLLEVRYRVVDGSLLRQVVPPGSAAVPPSQTVAQGLAGFACRHLPNGNLELQVSVQEYERIRILTTQVDPVVP